MGLEPGADWTEIRSRYKQLAKRLHPDATGGDRVSEERLKRVNRAYATLKTLHAASRAS
ncbi:MAG: DnaJ domain-containing protein [Tistlia sp.]|uniref:DnaJ domain-containing protein n=1 Tax=Tistlia sp. TaxID=3057121 RepID=UPI0034A12E6F